MNQEQDDQIEALLRRQFDGPTPDQGFSQRVMQALPPRRHRAIWPLWSGVLAGACSCWLVLLRSSLLRMGWRDWTNDHWSAPAITALLVMLGMAMLALVWSVAETEDR